MFFLVLYNINNFLYLIFKYSFFISICRCFERFFKAVNSKEGKLKAKRRAFQMDDVDLIGVEYIWRVVTNSGDEIANRAIELLKEVNTNLGPRLQASLVDFHETYISECLDRLRAHYDTVSMLNSHDEPRQRAEAIKMCRVMKVLQEYISECDGEYAGERKILPLHRACRGKHLSLLVRFSNPGRQVDDIEILTHSNDTLASFRRQVLRRIKATGANVKLDLFVNGDILEAADDRKLLLHIPLKDKMLLSAKLCQVNINNPSSPDSSSDSSTSSPHHPYDASNATAAVAASGHQEAEHSLPGVIMSRRPQCAQFLFSLADLGSKLEYPQLREGARSLLKLIPADTAIVEQLQNLFKNHANSESVTGGTISPTTSNSTSITNGITSNDTSSPTLPPLLTVESIFFESSPSQVLYNLEVIYAQLMPALEPLSDRAFEFQSNFFRSGDAHVVLEVLTKPTFLSGADVATRRSAYLTVLKISKLLLTVIGHVMAQVGEDSLTNPEGHDLPTAHRGPIAVLRQALHSIPNPNTEHVLRNVANKLAHSIADLVSNSFLFSLLINSFITGKQKFPEENLKIYHKRVIYADSLGIFRFLSHRYETAIFKIKVFPFINRKNLHLSVPIYC